MKTDNIDKLIEAAIDRVLATNPHSLSVRDVREELLTNNPLLLNSTPDNLDRRIDVCLARRFDPVRKFEMEREDFLAGRSEGALCGAEREAYRALCLRHGEELSRHVQALEALIEHCEEAAP